VRAHGGWIDKFIGDAMLAVFENPVEAMIAAQKMVRESRRLKVTDLMEQAVQVRVGLNTGIVAVANLGVPEHRERTVLGDAVNTAQRLQSAAQPHTIVLSARTFSRLPFALARTLEPIDVQAKGKKDTVLAYRWWIHSDRRAPDERIALRGSLLNAARRAPLFERLRGSKQGDSSGEDSQSNE
jgi:class 3 adenylate cyclase